MSLLLHSLHSVKLSSLSVRTNALAAVNDRKLPDDARRPLYPRKLGHEINSTPYVLDGSDGIFGGRRPLLLHFLPLLIAPQLECSHKYPRRRERQKFA